MFRGINSINLDSKGRLAIPTRYRAGLAGQDGSRCVVTIDTEASCLLLYPLEIWEEIEAQLAALPSFNPASRRIQRLLIGHATDVEVDGNGRLLIPPLLRTYATLEKRVILVGQGKKFEIWDEAQWTEERDRWLSQEGDLATEVPAAMQDLSL